MSGRLRSWLDDALGATLTPPADTSPTAYAFVAALRRVGRATGGAPPSLPDGVTGRTRTVGPDDGRVVVRCYRPRTDDGPLPVTVFLHGGGWISGDLDTNHRLCGHLAAETGRAVVAVDYRLAPEHRFPAQLDDCECVLDWVAARGPEHGLDPDDVALFGASAGGTLAAALCADRDAGATPPIRHQTLAYPPLDPAFDDRAAPGPLRRAARPLLAGLWDLYLPPDTDRSDPRVAPLRAPPETLPATTVVTCGIDPLRAEGRAYARRLAAAETGGPVAHVAFPTYPHGFLTLLPRVSRGRTVAALRRIRDARPTPRER